MTSSTTDAMNKIRNRVLRAALNEMSKNALVEAIITDKAMVIRHESAIETVANDLIKERESHAKATKLIGELKREIMNMNEAFASVSDRLTTLPEGNQAHITYPGGITLVVDADDLDNTLNVAMFPKGTQFGIGVAPLTFPNEAAMARLAKLERDTKGATRPFSAAEFIRNMIEDKLENEEPCDCETCAPHLHRRETTTILKSETPDGSAAPSPEELLRDRSVEQAIREATEFVHGDTLRKAGQVEAPTIIAVFHPEHGDTLSIKDLTQIETISTLIGSTRSFVSSYGQTFIAVFRSMSDYTAFMTLCQKYGYSPDVIAKYFYSYVPN